MIFRLNFVRFGLYGVSVVENPFIISVAGAKPMMTITVRQLCHALAEPLKVRCAKWISPRVEQVWPRTLTYHFG